MSFICGTCQFAGVNSGTTLETGEGFPKEEGLGHAGKDAGVGNNVCLLSLTVGQMLSQANTWVAFCNRHEAHAATVPPFTEETTEGQR